MPPLGLLSLRRLSASECVPVGYHITASAAKEAEAQASAQEYCYSLSQSGYLPGAHTHVTHYVRESHITTAHGVCHAFTLDARRGTGTANGREVT